VDANFNNLNTDKLESGDTAASLTISSATITGGTIDGATIGATTPAAITGTTITAAQYDSTEALPDIKPSLNLDFANVKKLDPRITYTRASTGAYYDGVTFAKAEENLLLRSQELDAAAWLKTNGTVAANTEAAPDGTTTADTLDEGAATGVHSLHQVPALLQSTTYTFSCFIKNVDAGFAGLAINTTSASNYGTVEFDLSGSGSVNRTNVSGVGFSIVASSITGVGNNWFRCVATITLGSASVSDARATIYMSDGSGSFDNRGRAIYTGTSKTIVIWGAQLEQRSALTDYTPTTTQPITNYVPALQTAASGEARFDHDPLTGESLGFLIEEQRTNLLLRSEEFETAWTTVGTATASTNQVIAPDGTLTADKFVLGATILSGGAALSQNATKPATSAPYTTSLYAKAGEFNSLRVILRDAALASNFVQAFFNLATGTIAQAANASGTFTAASATITAVGNGWYRVSVTGTSATETSLNVRILNYQDGTGVATGDGYSGIYIWGAQLEAGAFPTSYIKTVASQATRNGDFAGIAETNFSSWFGNTPEGSVYTEATSFGFDGISAANRRHYFTLESNVLGGSFGPDFLGVAGISNGVLTVARSGNDSTTTTNGSGVTSLTNGQPVRYATSFTSSAIGRATNGISGADINRPVTSGRFTTLVIGAQNNGDRVLNGTMRKLSIYPKAFNSATLQALTEE
jgi:hypothetical protein